MRLPIFDPAVFDPAVFDAQWVYPDGPTFEVTVVRGVSFVIAEIVMGAAFAVELPTASHPEVP